MNTDEIKKWWNIFVSDGKFVEIRVLGKFQYSGYFNNVDSLIKAVAPFAEMDDEQCYFTLNRINPPCYGRQQCERMIKSPKATTTDSDIIQRNWILIDFDPKRATGVNASEEEFESAHKKAQTVFAYLRKQGFSDPIICISGNGWHLLYHIELPNDESTTELIKQFLHTLSVLFTDDKVDIDEKVFNAGRICKLYGTKAKKGANLPDRPWRDSKIVYVPKEIISVESTLIQKIANLVPKDNAQNTQPQFRGSFNEKFDVESFLRKHNIGFKKENTSDGVKYVLEHCFFNESHRGKDAVIFQYNSGAVNYICLHNSCKNHTWREMRLALDPHAYDYENQPPRYKQYVPSIPEKPKYKIKDELPELGSKWLCMSDIKKVDLSALKNIKTGYIELDRGIVGLYMAEVTLLSGSNSSGKSSWLNNLLLNVIQQGEKAALWSGELPADILKTWIQMVAAGKNNLMPSKFGDGKYFVPQNVGEKIDSWLDGKFYLYNNEYGTKWEQIFHDMKELVKAGVKVFALDNLFTLDIDILEGDRNNKQKELILQIKDFAKKNQVHIILVAHPRKTMSFLRKNDISGTSDLTNAVDNCFIIHRVNKDFFKSGEEFFGKIYINQFNGFGNVIEVCKNRMYGAVDLLVGMHYESESRRFKNALDEILCYGWETQYQQSDISFNINNNVSDMPFEQSEETSPF